MWLEIIGRGLEIDEQVTHHIERRLQFALGRFHDRVGRLSVHLSDENGPRGGIDKRCRVVVELPSLGTIVVEDMNSQLHILIDQTLGRVAQVIRRRIDRDRPTGTIGRPQVRSSASFLT